MTTVLHRSAMSVAGLLVVGGVVAGPAAAAQAAPASDTTSLTTTAASSDQGGWSSEGRLLDIRYERQPNFYYCGPAATRIALTAQGRELSQDEVASRLGTTVAGTDSAADTTRVLNELTGDDKYRTTAIEASKASQAQIDQLRDDVRATVDDGRAVVANIIGTVSDVDGRTHSYPGGHYVTVVGYGEGGDAVKIADPAFLGAEHYWVSTETLAHWIATRGYSH
ncbi:MULTISPECIES: C39 family peptidase [unclassified Solwaraspora]|uniref:C39 family peptidase n=1 Tax=unclassified Solwaraspora TaxID=2627926 RepID=UPI00248BCBEB|nr:MULTISPECIES: C39 family peptidase [unclassified Solwaraspora]WBB95046.1 C39 family peptidase [Solwaraspora sp. WMMA2059]WBC21070.1 C39 family peptidase [Solwaraspora sp. WMMA2080]WJK36844.1 C39 family peptidase [Solwaraspora sp. WMMA2065]